MSDFALRRGIAIVVGDGDPAAVTIAARLSSYGSTVTVAGTMARTRTEAHTCVLLHRTTGASVPAVADFLDVAVPCLRSTQGSAVVVTSAAHDGHSLRELGGLIRDLASRERGSGVRINHVSAGRLLEEASEPTNSSWPPNAATYEDIAEAVCFLASDRAGAISGQHLVVGHPAAVPSLDTVLSS
jgi:hypothetical protein